MKPSAAALGKNIDPKVRDYIDAVLDEREKVIRGEFDRLHKTVKSLAGKQNEFVQEAELRINKALSLVCRDANSKKLVKVINLLNQGEGNGDD